MNDVYFIFQKRFILLVVALSIFSCGCEVSSGSENTDLNQFSYEDIFTFNFTTDSSSIVIQQSPDELMRLNANKPTISIVDSNLIKGKVILTLDVEAFDWNKETADPNTEFSITDDSLYFWYSAYSHDRFDQSEKQKGDGNDPAIHTPPAVPALAITAIKISKNPEMKINLKFLNPYN